MNPENIDDFAHRYTAAWCSQNTASVAPFFSAAGRLTINDATTLVGRAAISNAAQSFVTTFPDLIVELDGSRRRMAELSIIGYSSATTPRRVERVSINHSNSPAIGSKFAGWETSRRMSAYQRFRGLAL